MARTREQTIRFFAWAAAAALSALVASGCSSSHAYQGRGGEVLATYAGRTLTAELPPTVRVAAVVAAARQTMLGRGYAVRSSSATDENGRVVAERAGAGFAERVVVGAKVVRGGTRVSVTVEPLGDEAESRTILDAVLARLGR